MQFIKRVLSLWLAAAIVFSGSIGFADSARARDTKNTPLRAFADALNQPAGPQRYVDLMSEQGVHAQGLYITGPFVRYFGAQGVISAVRNAGLNAAVIDLKDDQGRVTFKTKVAQFQPQSKNLLRDVNALVRELKQANIYTIARVVCFNDNQLAAREPERAIHDKRPSKKIWKSWGTATHWLDPYNTKNHDVLLELTKEAESFGFDEVQLDYIRFPVDEGTQYAVYPSQIDKERRYVIRDFLKRVDEALSVPLGVDVFGLTAFHVGDKTGLGQSHEDWAPYVEVFSPMLYLNAMKSWGRQYPIGQGQELQRAQRLIQAGVAAMRQRLGAGPVIRPFLQAFPNGADYYDARFIREQLQGAYSGGAQGFLFWHPGSQYGMVQRSLSAGGNPYKRPKERAPQTSPAMQASLNSGPAAK